MIRLLLILFLLQINSSFASAQSLDDAVSAQHRGDFELADRIFRRLADNGDEDAQVLFARLLLFKKHTDIDYALDLLNSAALNGNIEAIQTLAMVYEGKYVPSVEKDFSKVIKWTRTLADMGDAHAQTDLAYYFKNGIGVKEDPAEAAMWYMMAAKQGNKSAQSQLAAMFRYGNGVQKNYVEAVKWYRLAASGAPHDFALLSLGEMHESGGFGLPLNFVEAYKYYHILCLLNSSFGGCTERDIVSKKMLASNISEAERKATICMKTNFTDCD